MNSPLTGTTTMAQSGHESNDNKEVSLNILLRAPERSLTTRCSLDAGHYFLGGFTLPLETVNFLLQDRIFNDFESERKLNKINT